MQNTIRPAVLNAPFVSTTQSATDAGAQPVAQTSSAAQKRGFFWHLRFTAAGMLLGVIFVKAEILSWFRIQEMFRFASFHMYGVIGTAVAVGLVSIQIIKSMGVKTLDGQPIVIAPKQFDRGQILGGLLFGMGWAMTGACPGPLFAQIGTGATAILITLLSAVAGTWTYGALRSKLPH